MGKIVEVNEYIQLLKPDRRAYALLFWDWLVNNQEGERPDSDLPIKLQCAIESRLFRYYTELIKI